MTAGHRSDVATTWIWEGVVPYLRRVEVAATVRELGALSDEGSRLIVNYQAPSLLAASGRRVARIMGGPRSAWAGERIRSTWRPDDMDALLCRFGFTVVADDDLLALARGLSMPARERHSLAVGRVAIADR